MRTYMSSPDIDTNFLRKTDAASTYAAIGDSYTKVESDNKYSLKGSGGGSGGGGLSASGFTMTGDIDMGDNKILKLADPVTSKSATNKEYVDNNFLSKHGGLILGDIAMSGQSITNLNPTPQNFNDAVTKKYVDDSISLAGGLSITGITMAGDIDMSGHNITGLSDPTNDDMAASKGFVESNFLDIAGGAMVGNVDMGGYEITNMLRTPTTDLSAVTKKWVSDEFPTKQEVLGGFTLTGALNLSGNEIYGLPDTPTTDNSATSKKYVDSKFVSGGGLSSSGFTMQGDINMNEYEVIGVTSVPSFNNSLVNKKYVDDEVSAVRGGITQAQGDVRYVRKTKYEYDNWMDAFTDMSSLAVVWSDHVRKSVIDSNTNLEIRTISVNTSLSAAVIKARKIEIYINYTYLKNEGGVNKILTNAKLLTTVDLSTSAYSAMKYKSSGTLHSFHVDIDHYLGNDTEATNSYLWQTGVKYEQHATTIGLFDNCYVSFALNKAGQYG